jgi:hypothetical protein
MEILEFAPRWAVGVALVLFAIREVWITYNSKNIALESIKKYQEIYKILEDLEEDLDSTRAAFFKGHDSGNPLNGLNKLYSSVIAATSNNDISREFVNKWTRVRVDNEYIETIQDIFKNKIITIYTDKLPKGSILRNLYESEGIKCAFAVLVNVQLENSFLKKVTKKPQLITFSYLSVTFSDLDVDEAYISEAVRGAANQLKYIINK